MLSPDVARLSPWTRQLLHDRERAMAQLPPRRAPSNGKAPRALRRAHRSPTGDAMHGCVLLSPVPQPPTAEDDPDFDARLQYRYLRDEEYDVAQKTAGEATPWRLCQTLASVDAHGDECAVDVAAGAFNTIVCDEDGANERSMTLAKLGETLPHRFPSLALDGATALRLSRVACKLRTALVPVAPSDRWRTEVRCVLRRPPAAERAAAERAAAAAPCALLLASQFGAALDVVTADDAERGRDASLPLQPTCVAEDRLGARKAHCYAIELTPSPKGGSPPRPMRSSSADPVARLGPVPVPASAAAALEEENGHECVAWQIAVPIGPALPRAPPPEPPALRKRKRAADADAAPDSECEGLDWLDFVSDCATDSEDESASPVGLRPARPAARPTTMARGRSSGPRRPLPVGLEFGHDASKRAVATAMRIARVPCHADLTGKLLRVEARAQAAALRRVREVGGW